jgi:hypothetical protein
MLHRMQGLACSAQCADRSRHSASREAIRKTGDVSSAAVRVGAQTALRAGANVCSRRDVRSPRSGRPRRNAGAVTALSGKQFRMVASPRQLFLAGSPPGHLTYGRDWQPMTGRAWTSMASPEEPGRAAGLFVRDWVGSRATGPRPDSEQFRLAPRTRRPDCETL